MVVVEARAGVLRPLELAHALGEIPSGRHVAGLIGDLRGFGLYLALKGLLSLFSLLERAILLELL